MIVPMTIYDIARESGVSASTVSRVLNGRKGINEETRRRVMQTAEKYNFSISENARSLVTRRTNMIGILVCDIRNQHHIEGAYMISQHFVREGYCSLLMNTGESDESKAEYVKILAARRINALVLIGSTFQCALVESAIRDYLGDIPVVFQNGVFDLPNVSSVVADEVKGSTLAVDWLLSRGRRHIAYVNNNDTPSNRKKIAGYSAAMKAHGLDDMIIPSCQDSAQGGADATAILLQEHPEVDSVIYAVDILAVGASRFLLDEGKRIPEDIAIFGTDNSPYSTLANPRLSTIDTRLAELSRECCDILSNMLKYNAPVEHRVVEPELVIRETG